MSRYALLQIGSLHLTHDGTSGGVPCKVLVQNEAAFASALVTSAAAALDFTPHVQAVDRGVKGIEFVPVFDYCPEALLADLVELLTTALADGEAVRVICTSLTSFDVMALPLTFESGELFKFESRSGGIAKGVQFRFISVSQGA